MSIIRKNAPILQIPCNPSLPRSKKIPSFPRILVFPMPPKPPVLPKCPNNFVPLKIPIVGGTIN